MMNVFHDFVPSEVLISVGPIKVYWYGLIMVSAMMVGLGVAKSLAARFKIGVELIYDLGFWLIIWGLAGARLYDVLLEWSYYSQNLGDILKIWQGGLAIHGAVIAGLMVVIIFALRHKLSFWTLAGVVVPGLVIGQAIGRWGNYFNQELFGRPTDLPWGIFIDELHRPLNYASYSYFQPTFLYESLCSLLIFGFLMWLIKYFDQLKDREAKELGKIVIASYFILFGLYRGLMEFIKIDVTPMIGGMRWPQIMSLILMIIGGIILYYALRNKERG
ncbi:MAG TPA: prolipoprotein diacylglyceryl transferase [bacterium]|nr:prolipoprotein diacylglyceryl transferase [bacterium]